LSLGAEDWKQFFRLMSREDRPWAVGELARRLGHRDCYDVAEAEPLPCEDVVELHCHSCCWRYVLTGEEFSRRVDKMLGIC
jgi:hypothetical protein